MAHQSNKPATGKPAVTLRASYVGLQARSAHRTSEGERAPMQERRRLRNPRTSGREGRRRYRLARRLVK
jgi:hypothetical protein